MSIWVNEKKIFEEATMMVLMHKLGNNGSYLLLFVTKCHKHNHISNVKHVNIMKKWE